MIHQWHWDPLRGRFSLERGVSNPSGEILEYNTVCISRHVYWRHRNFKDGLMQRWATLTIREEDEAILLLPAKGEESYDYSAQLQLGWWTWKGKFAEHTPTTEPRSFCSLCFDQLVSAVGEGSKSHHHVRSLKGPQTEWCVAKGRINTPSISITG